MIEFQELKEFKSMNLQRFCIYFLYKKGNFYISEFFILMYTQQKDRRSHHGFCNVYGKEDEPSIQSQ